MPSTAPALERAKYPKRKDVNDNREPARYPGKPFPKNRYVTKAAAVRAFRGAGHQFSREINTGATSAQPPVLTVPVPSGGIVYAQPNPSWCGISSCCGIPLRK